MSENYIQWPFRPDYEWAYEERQRWWSEVYVPGRGNSQFANYPHWIAITGAPGSGKSTALSAFNQMVKETSFIVDYPPDRWLGQDHEASHLKHMMFSAARAIRTYLDRLPNKVSALPDTQREFLRWLFEGQLGKRSWKRWVSSTFKNDEHTFATFENIESIAEGFQGYPQNPTQMQEVIDELCRLVHSLGFQRVLYLTDIPSGQDTRYLSGLRDLFGQLELMQHADFVLAIALPYSLLKKGNLVARILGCVNMIHMEWTYEECLLLAQRHLNLVLGENVEIFSYILPSALKELVVMIQNEYGGMAPAGWVNLMETLLYLAYHPQTPLAPPYTHKQLPIIRRIFFMRHMPIRLDMEQYGVWRGPRFIRLNEQLLNLVELLYQRRGRPINWDDNSLRFVAGSQDNVYAIVARTRNMIEPTPKKPIYVLSRRGAGGYWLENFR